MKTNKLFQLLVVGGALVTTGAAFAESSGWQRSSPSVFDEPQGAGELQPVFCDSHKPEICEIDTNGKAKVKDGFECCWGTSCAD